MPQQTRILDTPELVARQFAVDFANLVDQTVGDFHVALSGGSTPKLLFALWASSDCPRTEWSKVRFYWGDERCVPPDDPDSNFGVTRDLFFGPAGIPERNIHRVLGENDPQTEAARYGQLLENQLKSDSGKPVFDLVMLGMGSDGHTASIFPDQMSLMQDDRICALATHPDSGQQRVTITGPVIAAATRIAFLITGSSKTEKYRGIIGGTDDSKSWPATPFFLADNATIYMDQAVDA